MKRALLLLIAVVVPTLALCAPPEQALMELRLKTRLTSYTSKPGSPFECIVIRPLEINGQVLIPQGAIVRGRVRRAVPVGLGFIRERARLELAFEEYSTKDGQHFPLTAKLSSIDNSREQVTANGRIKGVLAAGHPNQLLFGLWERPNLQLLSHSLIGLTGASNQIWARFSMGPIGAGAMLILRCAIIKFPEPEIHLPPGTDLQIAVDLSSSSFAATESAAVPEVPEDVSEWLQKQPFNVARPNGHKAGDIINLAFLGTRAELVNSFAVAGWSTADVNSVRNLSHTYYAYNTMRQYSTAPVSTLLYQGAEPDMVFEKSLDTIVKRHHIRIWHAGILDGRDVWLGAATHDTGIAFDLRAVNFTHKIETNIDLERTKIATDLVFAGCSQQAGIVDRPNAVVSGEESSIATDGRIALLGLQTCERRTDFDHAEPFTRPGNKASRLTRRMILEARNHILRENAYYWGYQYFKHRRAERNGTA